MIGVAKTDFGRILSLLMIPIVSDHVSDPACMETVETPIHVMLHGVVEQRAAHLGSSATLHEALVDLGGLLSFWSELGWLE
ncbi:jg7062 [Pararge aegeria aegeria]|uniref:Jg7062 protein n=1 Tax=Pararge aegeria aegeria TaxID=348720 RepID=A0A8S4RKA7_9NEOP|nr:jg7062 [Pararge aegeria aegeria]